MYHAFISYGHSGAGETARRLAGDLECAGLRVWWDEPEIRAGQCWDVRIEQGIEQSSAQLGRSA
ncbi:MAG: toll/interleukin-1 receptor domain-containing protein [Armatimonadota bacterium]